MYRRTMGAVVCALVLAVAPAARADQSQLGATDVALSLNLRYTDPFNPAEGGVWSLVAQTGSANGISAISAYMSNISGVATTVKYGNGVLNSPASGYAGANINGNSIGAITSGGNPFVTTIGSAINLL